MGRILFVASTFSHIRNFHRPYLHAFSIRGWQVDVACAGTPLELDQVHQTYTIPLEKSMTSPRNLAAARQLRALIRENRYDVISCHTALASFFVRLAVIGLRHRPLVACTCHGYLFDQDTPTLKRLVLSGAERLTAPVTDLLMTMNQWDTQYAAAHKLGKKVAIADLDIVNPYFRSRERRPQLEAAGARVLCTATTHMYPPAGMPLARSTAEAAAALEPRAFSGIHLLTPTALRLLRPWPETFSIIDFYLSISSGHRVRCASAPSGAVITDIGKTARLR